MPIDKETLDKFAEWGAPPPKSFGHGTPEELAQNREPVRPKQWRMEGNKLIGETEFGTVCQFLPTNIICLGTDAEGLPILKEIVL